MVFSCFLGLSISAKAQDSLTVITKNWNTEKIAKGIVWKQGSFENLFESQQEINFIEIDTKRAKKSLKLAADSQKLKKTSVFAKEKNALAAINGGFFDMKNGGAVDYIKVNNEVVNVSKNASERANAVLNIDRKFVSISNSTKENTEDSNAENVILSGPLLISNSQEIALSKNAFNANRHPRTAVAITKNKVLLVVVDGRNAQANGMSLTELSKFLKWYGAKDAMNLDGGGSSALYLKSKGIVSYPSDNKLFDHEGERSVANILYVK